MRRILSIVLLSMLLCTSVAFSGNLKTAEIVYEGRDCIEVTNSFYRAIVDPGKGGRLSWLSLAGSNDNMADERHAIANIGLTTWDKPYSVECTTSADGKMVSIRLSCDDVKALINKTLIFRDDTPTIQCHVELVNTGKDRMLDTRVYNQMDVRSGGGENDNASIFFDTNQEPMVYSALLNKWLFQTDLVPGLGGIFFGDRESALIFFVPEGLVHKYTLWASPETEAYEINLNKYPFEKGQTFSFDFFLSPIKAASVEAAVAAAKDKQVYSDSLKAIIEKPLPKRDEAVEVSASATKILIVGKYAEYSLWRFVPVLEQCFYKPQCDLATMVQKEGGQTKKDVHVKHFPLTPKAMSEYRMIILVNCPGTALSERQWKMVTSFVASGGTLILAGDHAVFYDGLGIAELIPAAFDHARLQKLRNKAYLPRMDDKSKYSEVIPAQTEDLLNIGLDYAKKPIVSVHKSVIKENAKVHLKTGQWPLLTSIQLGKGTIYSFPAAITDRIDTIYGTQEIQMTEKQRLDGIFWWDSYDELWRRIYAKACGYPLVVIDKFGTERSNNNLACNFSIRNIPASCEKVEVDLRLEDEAGNVWNEKAIFNSVDSMAAGALTVENVLDFQDVKYSLRILDIASQTVEEKTGTIGAVASKPFVFTVGGYDGLITVYKPGSPVPCVLENDTNEPVELILTDPWGKTVWNKKLTENDPNKIMVPTAGMANGKYMLTAKGEQYATGRKIDILRKSPNPDEFNIAMYSPPSSLQDDPYEWEKGWQYFKKAGFTSYTMSGYGSFTHSYDLNKNWRERNTRRMADYAQLQGIDLNLHFFEIFGGWDVGHFVAPDAGCEKRIIDKYKIWLQSFSMAPNLGLSYIFDEPFHNPNFDCAKCKVEFAEKFGREAPQARTSPDYYDFKVMKEKHSTDKLIFGREVLEKIDSRKFITTWGATNNGGVLSEDVLELAANTDVFTCDNYAGNWFYDLSAEAVLSAKGRGGNLGFMNIAAIWYGGINVDPLEHARYAYAALGRGARILAWWTWYTMSYNGALELNVERFNVIAQINDEVKKIGPVLNQYLRTKAKVAMLVPICTMEVLAGNEQTRNMSLSQNLLKNLQPNCGNLDYLFPEQIAHDRLDEYDIMVIAGEKILSETNLAIIKDWVQAGGTLVLFEDALSLNTRQEPSKVYNEMCPAKKGKESTVFKRGKGRILHFAKLPQTVAAMACLFEENSIDGSLASSNNAMISPYLFSNKADNAHCVIFVNTADYATEADIRLDIQGQYSAYSLLTGQQLICRRAKDGKTELSLKFEKYWGDAVLLLPKNVGAVKINIDSEFICGKKMSYSINMLDTAGELLQAAAPVNISVLDPEGNIRQEYSGYHVFKNGIYSEKITLPVNELAGDWKIIAESPLGGQKVSKEFKVKPIK